MGTFGWNRSYRFKLIFLAVVLALCGQLLVVLITYFNVRDTTGEMRMDENRQLYTQYGSRMTDYFKEMNALSTYLRSKEITDFSRYYWNLRDPKLAEAKLNDLHLLIDRMKLSDLQVDSIYMLGNNVNQTGFSHSITSFLPSLKIVPTVDDFEKLGFLGTLLRNNGFPVYYEQGEWSERLDRLPTEKLALAESSGVKDFLISLEGRISITSYAENVLQSVLLRTDIFDRLLNDVIASKGGGMLLDLNNHIVWSNPARFANPAFDPSDIPLSASGEGRFALGGQDIRYQVLSPYGFIWVQYDSVQLWGDEHAEFLWRMMLVFVVGISASAIVSWWTSRRICEPLTGLAHMLKRKGKSLPIRPIPNHLQNKVFWRSLPLKQKVFYHFLLTAIAPVLIFGILCSTQAGNLAKGMLYESMDQGTSRLVQDIRVKQIAYENLIRRLTANGAMAAIARDQRVIGGVDRSALESLLVNQTASIGDIAYFALRSTSGTALYASIYPNNLELFYTDVDWDGVFDTAESDLAWLEGKRDVSNQLTLTLVARLTDSVTNVSAGYLQIALELTSLQVGSSKPQSEYVIIEDEGRLVAGSVTDDRYVKAAQKAAVTLADSDTADKPFEANIDGRDYLLAARFIPGTDWTVVSYQPMLEISSTSRSLLERNLGITLIASVAVFLLSMILSRWLVRPIERLKLEMERVGQGNVNSMIAYEGVDEISELINSFNIMTEQINDLINDNIMRQVRERELDRLKTHAELGMLQQQINPHFLYNTLEAINMCSLQLGATDVSRMVTALARLFRYAISSASDRVELRQELEHTRNYITIQQIRFRDRFIVNWNIEPQTEQYPVLKLLLQPIVENAINHGLAEYTANGIVEISSRLEGSFLLIDVIDNGIGMETDELDTLLAAIGEQQFTAHAQGSLHKSSTGVGLRNVYLRLKFHYGEEADMTISSVPLEGTQVQIKIPI